jgi:ribonuclease P protein component
LIGCAVSAYGFPKAVRLLRSPQFERVQRRGSRRASDKLAVQVVGNEVGRARFGLAVSRKVGNAVVRNRIKRHLREAARHLKIRVSAVDVVIAARAGAAGLGGDGLRAELERLLGALGVLRSLAGGGATGRSAGVRS